MNQFHGEDVYFFILSELRLYTADNLRILAEVSKGEATLYIFSGSELFDVRSIPTGREVRLAVRNWIQSTFSTTSFYENPVLDKLEQAYSGAVCSIVIRHLSKTRGGEYVELGYLLGKVGNKELAFLSKSGVELSTMANEVLQTFGVTASTYRNLSTLTREVEGITRHAIARSFQP